MDDRGVRSFFGAGGTADLMVFAAHGLYGCSCITALTVQSTVGVAAMYPGTASVVRATLDHLADDLKPAGIKIGMLGSAEVVDVVAGFLEGQPKLPVVLDPVLVSSSGRALLSADGLEAMRERLLPLVSWITPNVDELEVLADVPVERETMEAAARALIGRYPGLTVLATGGHLERPDDLLVTPDGGAEWIEGESIDTSSTHGTGCALSAALLSRLVLGDDSLTAARAAKQYVAEAMRTAIPRGRGRGPLNHLWPLTYGNQRR